MKKRWLLRVFLVYAALAASAASAADVYYLGDTGPERHKEPTTDYSASRRLRDLTGFSSYGADKKERSGWITGNFSQGWDYQNIGGNASKSFLTQGAHYLSELNLTMFERLWKDYSFDGQVFLRKTDDPRAESGSRVHFKQLSVKVANTANMFEFGNFYAEFSQFVLGASLEGFHLDSSPSAGRRYALVVSRAYEANPAANLYQRNVYGLKADHSFFAGSSLFSNFRLGLQGALTRDDAASLAYAAAPKLDNSIIGLDGDIALKKNLSLAFEAARSVYTDDLRNPAIDHEEAWAFRARPAWTAGKFQTRYLFNYAAPKFHTETGSAAPDKQQHQLDVDWRIGPSAALSATENLYWDDLPGSARTKRTTYDEKRLRGRFRPFSSRAGFAVNPYLAYVRRDSNDPGNTLGADTFTTGLEADNSFSDGTSAGLRYEYRAFSDRFDRSRSERYHRVALNAARDTRLFKRRLYAALDLTADFRHTRTSDNPERSLAASFNGQYDVHRLCTLKFGHNVQDTNNGRANGDFGTRRSFGEADILLQKLRATHLLLRGERNVNSYEDAAQNYRETRITAKFVSNF